MDELHENSRDDNVDKQRGKQTKKRKVQDDDDEEEEHENTHDSDDDSSSTHKKGRVFWSQELHHKFVLAVNQLSIDKAVPRKVLDLMKVENLTRENIASHLQKYRLHLKKQANMVAASGNGNPSNLRMGSLSGVGSFQTLSGSEKFHHNNAFGSFPTALNNPAGQNVYGLPSSGTHQFGQAQNFNSSNNYDQLKFQSAIGHRYQNVIQATPISKWFSDQFPDSLTDIHSQGVFSASTSKQVNNNMPFQWWDDHNEDASNYSNVIGSSMNSLTPMNGAVGPECHTSTNSTFNRNPDFYFGDPVQMKHEGIMEFNVGNSVKPQQVHTINQQESQKSCVANNVRSFEELIAASSSGSSQESAEIAELRKEMAETRYEHLKLKEMMVQQDRLLQTIIQFVCTMQQQPEPALNLH